VRIVRAEGVKALLVENYYDTKSANVVARHTGAKVVPVPGDVGGVTGADTYEKYIDSLVKLVTDAVK
jgi:zinc/manganese transport system substrate-binding protein